MTVSDAQDHSSDPLAEGRAALAAGRWGDAFEIVRAFVAGEFKAESLELLGLTAWYVDNADVAFDAFDAAYRLSVDAGDQFGAARDRSAFGANGHESVRSVRPRCEGGAEQGQRYDPKRHFLC